MFASLQNYEARTQERKIVLHCLLLAITYDYGATFNLTLASNHHRLHIATSSWKKDSFGLFDFECKEL